MRAALSLGVLALVACGGAEPGPEGSSALDDAAYRFCHVPGASAEEALRWCDLLEDLGPERCPGLRATCEEGVVAEDPVFSSGCQGEGRGTGPADRLASAPERPPDERRGCDELELEDPEGLALLLRWVVAIGVAVAIGILFRVAWGSFGALRRPRAPTVPAVSMVDEPEDELPDVPDAPGAELLSAARAALAAGRVGEAALLARGASLRHLGDTGHLRLHRSRTDREYVRGLRRTPELQADLREILVAVEHHRWGGSPLGIEQADRALDAAARVLSVALVGLLLLCGVAGSAHAQTPQRYGPYGDAALIEVLEAHGYSAGWRLRSLYDLDEDTDAMILDLSEVVPDPEQWEQIRSWVQAGGVLVVGGDATSGVPELGQRTALPIGAEARLAPPLQGIGLQRPRWPDGPMYAFTEGQPWVTAVDPVDGADSDGVASVPAVVSVVDLGAGVVVGIADPRLLWNGAFVHPANEAFMGDLLYLGQGLRGWPLPTPARVQLATRAATSGSGSGSGGPNPLASMANAKLLPFVLQLLATWALLGLWRGWPFAPLRDPEAAGRLSFSEHVQALGTRWFRLGASRHALVQLASLWLARLGPSGLQLAAQRHGYSPQEARAWVAGLVALVEEPEGPDDPEDLERMEELWKVTQRPE